MGEETRTNGTPAVTIAEGDPARIRAQIEATRLELGDTVAALAVKADVRQQAANRIAAFRRRPRSPARARPLPLAVGGAIAAGFLLGRITKR
jgi:hypothetical protein